MQNKQNMHFSPSEIAEIFEVNESTIKRWIDKGFLHAIKTPGGHRRIAYEQLTAFAEKYPQFASNSYVMKGLLKTRDGQEKSFVSIREQFEKCVRNGDIQAGIRLLQKYLVAGIPMPQLIDEIVVPVYRNLFQTSNAADDPNQNREGGAVIAFREILRGFGSIVEKSQSQEQTSRRAVVACIRDEYNELPLHFLLPVLYANGYSAKNYGMNASNKTIVHSIPTEKPDVVVLHHSKESSYVIGCLMRILMRTRKSKVHLICYGKGWSALVKRQAKKMDGITFINNASQLNDFLVQRNADTNRATI